MLVFSKAKFLEVEGSNAQYLGDDPRNPKRRWIDWFDGVEMPFDDPDDPFGRIVVFYQGMPFFIRRDWCVEKED